MVILTDRDITEPAEIAEKLEEFTERLFGHSYFTVRIEHYPDGDFEIICFHREPVDEREEEWREHNVMYKSIDDRVQNFVLEGELRKNERSVVGDTLKSEEYSLAALNQKNSDGRE